MKIKVLNRDFLVCKVENYEYVDLNDDFIFIGKTNEEKSLVCEEKNLPSNATEIEKDWKCMVIEGVLDFSLVGIIAKISQLLSKIKVSVFVISTFNTDYILIKKEELNKSIDELERNGYEITEE
ncbi:ACT domain-containing protein [Miniphocaeibacter halophilus]|uniref:ACT domain-containing protein n=1 Tax=Miniphocaeibacter halophilus TaxID=2931922 RepID=A0AC61MZD9_9FIRM|nr:ACT domain-containing protein [Miniphocaeibacter halophilus]QQK08850.1 ACT domain-containing protein [Miniphocaeibacter halophilus]